MHSAALRALIRFALLSTLLAGPTFGQADLNQTSQPSQAKLDSGEVKGAIDAGLRWLRAKQDEQSGGYGSVRETSGVLRAFLASPRGYHVSDGPFLHRALQFLLEHQGPDGSIAEKDAGPLARLSDSIAAFEALMLVTEEPGLTARRRLAGFLGTPLDGNGEAGRDGSAGQAKLDPALASQAAARLLALRTLDKVAWDGPDGTTLATARALQRLAELHAALPSAEQAAVSVAPLPAIGSGNIDSSTGERAREGRLRGARFLAAEAIDGGRFGFENRPDAGITAMVAGALQSVPAPRPEDIQAAIDSALDYLLSLQKEDGSIHDGSLHNYVTSASILALAKRGTERDMAAIARAREYLRVLQADEGEGYAEDHRFYGGVGYGGDERPDLSNLQLALEALSVAGLESGDESFRKAVAFLERTQNRSESNDIDLAEAAGPVRAGDDGGAAYAPGESKAGFAILPNGTRVPRSYGSMTYALLRGYLFAGLERDDPRVAAAIDWIRANWTLDRNPGFEFGDDPAAPYQGLFYYFLSMGKALDTLGEESFVDAAGNAHPWRTELSERILSMQRPDGSWRNENSPRWWEGNPVLATAYGLLVLEAALPE